MVRHYEKTYSIRPIKLSRPRRIAGKQRYCVISDGSEHIDLNYATPAKALEVAERFTKHCYQNFTDFQGNKVVFSFRQL